MNTCQDIQAEVMELGGEEYYFSRRGTGEVIILLHGWTDSSRSYWQHVISYFENHYTLIALDLRGHGCSAKPAHGYAPTDQAQLVAKLVHKLGLEKPVLLGHSLGGVVAAKYAILFPNRLSALIISDSPLGAGFWKNMELLTHMPPAGALLLGSMLVPFFGKMLYNLRTPNSIRLIVEHLHVLYRPTNMTTELIREKMGSSYEATMQSIIGIFLENLEKDLGTISAPTLIIQGDHDSLVPLDWAEIAASRIPDAQLALIENAGHFPMLEQPEKFNQIVSKFLSGSLKDMT
jgi:pimeloyl-ACP methyl ester carboxylesterase